MGCKNYKFEWTADLSWRLTSRRGMVWEGTLCPDNVDSTLVRKRSIVILSSKITKGENTPIPINGVEKLRYYTQRLIVNAMDALAKAVAR